jgi:hypothetical protein
MYKYKKNDSFYDIESLQNLFTNAQYFPNKDLLILSYIDDDAIIHDPNDGLTISNKTKINHQIIEKAIRDLIPEMKNTRIFFENLSITDNRSIKQQIGNVFTFTKRFGRVFKENMINSFNDDETGVINKLNAYYPIKQTDTIYDANRDGLFFGYNSTNYDLTVLSYFIGHLDEMMLTNVVDPNVLHAATVNNPFKPSMSPGYEIMSASQIRTFNDRLFDEFKRNMRNVLRENETMNDIHRGWLITNRFIDVSNLNEKQSRVGLKRLAGMLGLQIKESERLSNMNNRVNTIEDVAELFSYNVSDVWVLQKLFEHRVYQNNFTLKNSLLEKYPANIYKKKSATDLSPDIDPNKISLWRLTTDSTSAKFIANVIAPYNKLEDIPAISFNYPAESVAKKRGIPVTNVLEDTFNWAAENMTPVLNKETGELENPFQPIYNVYKNIEGKNANETLSDLPYTDVTQFLKQENMNFFYQNADGSPSSGMVTFSIGGIHGQEINQAKYERIYNEKMMEYLDFQFVYDAFNGDATAAYNYKGEDLVNPATMNTIKRKAMNKSTSRVSQGVWKEIVQPTRETILFSQDSKSGMTKLRKDFTYTSAGKANHEDFTSYYPLLMSMLAIFLNTAYGEDFDPYYALFEERVSKKTQMNHLRKEMVQKEAEAILSEIEKLSYELEIDALDLLQDAIKLLLNAASGAADATFNSNIRKNNAIISMRIIGQLFAWRIGQAQTKAGAIVPSTNTDGLYSMNISEELNNKILDEIVAPMHIGIEPEVLDRFVTKDSNNRMEYVHGKVVSARGGHLTSHAGPTPTNSLAHPAISDYVLAHYLAEYDNAPNLTFNRGIAHSIMDKFIEKTETSEVLRYFSWIVAASPGKGTYPFLIDKVNEKIQTLQHYNRIFLVSELYSSSTLRQASRQKVNANTVKKRIKNGEASVQHEPTARRILLSNGYVFNEMEYDEATIKKVTGLPDNQSVKIENGNLTQINGEELLKQLDLSVYIDLVETTFNNSWKNDT